MAKLTGKVVLVTGAGKGTGRAIAQECAVHGARLAINDLTPVNLDETEANIRRTGGQVKAYIVDVTKKMPIQSLVNSVLEDWGRIDILINCAKVKPKSSLMEMDDWDWQRTLDVNLSGVFLLMQSVGRVMSKQGGGSILTIGLQAETGENQAAYAISQAALAELSARVGTEFSTYNIQVHLIQANEMDETVHMALRLCS